MIHEVVPPGLYNMHLSITPKHPTLHSYNTLKVLQHSVAHALQPLYSSFPYNFVLSVMHSRVHPTSQGSDQHYDLLLARCCDVLKCPLTDNDQWHPATPHTATEAKLRFSSGVCLANSTRTYYQLTSVVEATTCTKCRIPNH